MVVCRSIALPCGSFSRPVDDGAAKLRESSLAAIIHTAGGPRRKHRSSFICGDDPSGRPRAAAPARMPKRTKARPLIAGIDMGGERVAAKLLEGQRPSASRWRTQHLTQERLPAMVMIGHGLESPGKHAGCKAGGNRAIDRDD